MYPGRRRVSTYLQDVPSTLAAVSPGQRNARARTVFQGVEIRDDRVVAIVPRAEFASFFNLIDGGRESTNDEGQPIEAAPVCQYSTLAGGSDGDRLREIDVVELPLVPLLYPERLLHSRRRSGVGRYAPVTKGPLIPREQWSEIVVRVQREGLRAVARDFGVSHETVRAVVKRVEHGAIAA